MNQPNILLIIVDCGRADHVGAYGHTRDTTPTIDRLASEGIRFENAFSSGGWTLESVAALYTGLYSSQHGVNAECPVLGVEPTTLASYLQTTHTTAAFSPGAWHGRRFGFARGFSRFQETYRRPDFLNLLLPTPTRPEWALRRISRQFGIAFLRGRALH
jgi:arylsulfatase A-like enzyme